ncbi:hypothetical protein KY290_007901 [Solanum tuberosum]|uniref:Endonuclease/exonuclease/phosphatase domain-containing protein n=1 Tax=Solanum tuberosum TaxID=4113 RepID=A0ABQ7W918_SOLTU|nr:hypothetical protein KY290_007901 [Solanum tuberosum]
MSWIIWNVRGINKWYKKKELKLYLRNKHIKLAALLETRVKDHKAPRVFANVFPGLKSLNKYSWVINGGVWMVWDPNFYQVTHIRSTTQSIHCLINGITGTLSCLITVIYAFNSIENRKDFWAELTLIEPGVDRPWFIVGGFNAMLYPNDRLCCAPIALAETQDFSNCLHTLQLNEVSWRGDYYTWNNKQMGADRIYSRIDRVFGNMDGMMTWGHVVTTYELPYIFDHSPMLLTRIITGHARHPSDFSMYGQNTILSWTKLQQYGINT